MSKPVSQYTRDSCYIRDWPSVKEAAKQLGGNEKAIRECINGRSATSCGYKWRYTGERPNRPFTH